ncbi:MAG: hypothetical protein J0I12_28915 [Candidatus Eremiobacteraeota bacterium]|nr:hypothetical protein [Candidatus Eremiobacteraeota bacterium]
MKLARRGRHGGIAVVMVTLMLVVLLLFFSLTAGIQHYQMSSTLDNRARARDLAETAIHLTLSQLCKTPTWTGTINVPAVGRFADGEGHLSFTPSVAHGWGIPNSTNNLQGLVSASGDGRTVPRSSAHLISIGSFGGQKLQVETIYARPPWPTGLATQGPTTLQAVQLWGQPPDQSPSQPPIPNPWEPANVLTNCPGGNALIIEPDCRIYGNAVACGAVDVRAGAEIQGEVHAWSSARTLPHFDIPAIWTNLTRDVGLVPFLPGEKIETFVVMDGPLTTSADVELNGGILAVNGDLTINGKLSGSGFVLTTGNLTTGAGVNLEAQDRLAVLVQKDLILNGSGQNFYLSGLVYAKGKIECHDLTVHGAMIQDDPTKSLTVNLRRTNVIRDSIGTSGAIGLPNPFQYQRDHYVLGVKTSRGEFFEMHLQTRVDPANNTKRLLVGQAALGDNQTETPEKIWPPFGTDRSWTITFDPPKAVWRFARAGFQNGRVNPGGDPSDYTREEPFDGSPGQCESIIKRVMEEQHPDNWGAVADRVTSPNVVDPRPNSEKVKTYIQEVMNATGKTVNLDLNSLLPPIEVSKFQTWRESAPSR